MASLLFLLILAVLAGMLLVGIYLWASGGRGGSGDMSCGACGYNVRGLTELNCPECGADLRMVGINRPGDPRTKALGRTLVFASVGIFLIGFLASIFLFNVQGSPPSVPASVSQPAPGPSPATPDATLSSSPIENAGGTNTIERPDGSKIVIFLDGSSTIIQPDGSMKSYDPDGVEIPNPEPQGDDTPETP